MKRFAMYVAGALPVLAATTLAQAASLPEMTGPWVLSAPLKALKTVDGKPPPLNAEGQKAYAKNKADPQSDPLASCLPPGIPRTLLQAGFPFSIIRGEDFTGMMFQWNHLPRVIYMNVQHFENIGPTYLGQSVGHWEGSTLVVDTNAFNERTWLDDSGLPHSDQLHVVERYALKGANTLEDNLTIEDAKYYSKPWSVKLSFTKKPGAIVQEDYCLGRTGQGTTVSK